MRVAALEREIKRDKWTAEMDAGDEPRLEKERETREVCQGVAGPVRLNPSLRYNWIDAAVRTVLARKNINDQ